MDAPLDLDRISDADILSARPPKSLVDPWRPYGFFVERERTAAGDVEDVATILLTNRECPFRCLMCDLWRHTTDERVPPGAIPAQLEYALARLPAVRHVKLYNSGNFFDAQAIPREDHRAIAGQLGSFATVVVENHPKLCTAECLRFRERIGTTLEIAIGLETVHPRVLPLLNKQMSLDDFNRAVQFLGRHGLPTRAFILLRPPLLSEAEGVEWAVRSVRHAFSQGVGCCSVIPTRAGNGLMEQLARRGLFAPPRLESLERVLDECLALGGGRVFVDLWDVERLFSCSRCGPPRARRLERMNHAQQRLPPVDCDCDCARPA